MMVFQLLVRCARTGRRFHNWKKQSTEREIASWQTNPADLESLKEASEVFSSDARRYFPKANQGNVVSGLTWNNRPDYFLDTWEGFSQMLKDINPKQLQADVFLPQKRNVFGPKGYVKREFKETARFEKISFSFAGTSDYYGTKCCPSCVVHKNIKEKQKRAPPKQF